MPNIQNNKKKAHTKKQFWHALCITTKQKNNLLRFIKTKNLHKENKVTTFAISK